MMFFIRLLPNADLKVHLPRLDPRRGRGEVRRVEVLRDEALLPGVLQRVIQNGVRRTRCGPNRYTTLLARKCRMFCTEYRKAPGSSMSTDAGPAAG